MYRSKEEKRIHKRVKEKKYKLHSKGENWWHFRSNPNSIMESFTVSRVHDGTIVLTGDMGCLAHRREYFKEDTPFPCTGTSLNYFLQKVYHEFECYEFDPKEAIKELTKDIKETYFEDCGAKLRGKVNRLLEDYDYSDLLELEDELSKEQYKAIEFVGELSTDMDKNEFYHEMRDFNSDTNFDPDWWERDYGKKVKIGVLYGFELLKVWGDYMWKEIEKEKRKQRRGKENTEQHIYHTNSATQKTA